MTFRQELLLFIAVFLLQIPTSYSQSPELRILYKNLATAKADTQIANGYLKLIGHFLYEGQYDSCRKYLDIGIKKSLHFEDKKILANFYNFEGTFYKRQLNYQLSLASYEKGSLLFGNRLNETKYKLLYNKGVVYTMLADYTNAVKVFIELLKYVEKNNIHSELCSIYLSIGNIYFFLEDYKTALLYFEKANGASVKNNNLKDTGSALGSIGAVFVELKQYEKALPFYSQQMDIALKINNKVEQCRVYYNLSLCHSEMGNNSTAIDYCNKALSAYKQRNDYLGVFRTYKLFSLCYKNAGDFRKALSFDIKGDSLIKGKPIPPKTTHDSFRNLAEINEKLGSYQEALLNYKFFYKLRDSITSVNRIKQVELIRSEYEDEKKQLQIEILSKNLTLKTLQANRQSERNTYLDILQKNTVLKNILLEQEKKIQRKKIELQNSYLAKQSSTLIYQSQIINYNKKERFFILSMLILLFIIGSIIYISLRNIKATNKILKKQKCEIESQAEQLVVLNSHKDKIFSIISHDLRSPIYELNITLSMLEQHIPVKTIYTDTIKHLHYQTNILQNTLDNILHWSLNQIHDNKTKFSLVSLSNMIEDIVELTKPFIAYKSINLSFDFCSTHLC